MLKHYHDRRLLGWLDSEIVPPPPPIVLYKQIRPEQWDIWKLAASTEELGIQTGHFAGTSRGHSSYFFCYNQSYFIEVCAPLPFVIATRNLQLILQLVIIANFVLLLFNSIIVPTTGNKSNFSYDNASPNVQLLQKEIFETFSKCLPSP